MNDKLNIIYRVCDSVMTASPGGRCFNISKNMLVKKCLNTLKKNLDNLSPNIKLKFYCIYDNCSDDIINYVKSIYNQVEFIKPKISGNAGSFCECVDIALKLHDDDICYFLEDDYLFLKDNVLNELFHNLNILSYYNKQHVAIMPDDYPDRYHNNMILTECRITDTGHFLRIDSTTCTFATYADIIKRHVSDLKNFINWPKVGEAQSINACWKDTPLYLPIPAWTLHSQHFHVFPIYINKQQLKNYFESPL